LRDRHLFSGDLAASTTSDCSLLTSLLPAPVLMLLLHLILP
jgi:hypothetical protein